MGTEEKGITPLRLEMGGPPFSGFGILALLLVTLITAMGIPSGVQAPEFRVVDEHGQTRALLNGQGLTFADEEGKLLASVAAL